MSAVIPKDLTGLVRDPTKMDAWVKGTRGAALNNLCAEMPLPITAYSEKPNVLDNFCKLGMPGSLADYLALGNYYHMVQVHSKFRTLIDHPKIIYSFYSGATPDQLMPALDAEALALRLIAEHEGELTQLDNVLGVLTSTYLQESIQLFGSLAVNNSLKERQLMQATSNVLSKSGPGYVDPHHPDANHSGEAELRSGTKVPAFHGEIPANFQLPNGGFKPGEMVIMDAMASDGVSKLGSLLESVDGTTALVKHPKLKSLDQVRKPKRKKSKPKSAHIPNMNNHSVKRALGATILMKLGQVQRDTSDAYKRAMLRELPAADLLEMATGEKLPDYQANLINNMQAKADPSAPVVERMGSFYKESIADDAPVNEELNELLAVSNHAIELGRGLTNVLVHYDDGIELTNEQRQALLEEREGREGVVDILLADGKVVKFTIDADDPDPEATIAIVKAEFKTTGDYNSAHGITDMQCEYGLTPYIKTDEFGRESYHYDQTSFKYVGGPTRRDIEFTNRAVRIFRHYEDFTANACSKLGITLEELERIITNDIFWNELTFNLRLMALKKVDALICLQLGNSTEYIDHFIESFIVDFVKRDKE